MAIYLYRNPKTNKVIEVFQSIHDKHEYVNEAGLKYERVFTVPNTAIDSQIDPFSSKDFVNKTKNKNMSLGEMWDASRDASEKREKIQGKDSTKAKYFEKYAKTRRGMKHQSDPSR
jgi:hypothetical protein